MKGTAMAVPFIVGERRRLFPERGVSLHVDPVGLLGRDVAADAVLQASRGSIFDRDEKSMQK
jgi:hypothetical protein